MKIILRFLFVSVILSLCALWGIKSATAQPKKRLVIVATTSMIGDSVQNIVQGNAEVITLMGAGVDPHAYKATLRDIQQLNSADIVFYNGLDLEGKMSHILKKMSKKKRIYAVADTLAESQVLTDPNFAIGKDPHIWFDISLWQQAVQYMSQQLQAADPQAADDYRCNTADYLGKLAALHQETAKAIRQIPPTQRVLITSHDAFGYFGRAYGIEVRGLQGISTIAECGLKDMTDLVQFIIKRDIKAVFPETSVPDKPLKAVLEGCHQRGHSVILGGYLYSDALGEPGTPEGTYYGMIQANTAIVLKALH